MTKIWLVEGFCPKDKYYCLMPVEYDSVEHNGVVREYRKAKIGCRHVKAGGCEYIEQCRFFQDAPETLAKDANWYED